MTFLGEVVPTSFWKCNPLQHLLSSVNQPSIAKLKLIEKGLLFHSDPIDLAAVLFSEAGTVRNLA
jgi:hypothetical protein